MVPVACGCPLSSALLFSYDHFCNKRARNPVSKRRLLLLVAGRRGECPEPVADVRVVPKRFVLSSSCHSLPPTRNMKVYASICAMVLLFHLAVCVTITGPEGADPPTSCCSTYLSRKIPFRLLADFYRTSERCSTPAIVFITKKGRQICANPAERWVQDYVSHLEQN